MTNGEKYFYDDPFDSKENKIKVSKLLVDELDSTGLSSFLPHFLESDSILYEDFSEVDTLTSTDNEDKVFNPGVHSLLLELSHRDSKAFKVINISESPIEIFPCSYGEDIRVLDVPCLHFYPPITPDYKASRARGFVHRSLELHILSFIMGIEYPNLID
ncbi:hypothetical protein Tco_0252105 [Tanacetum coccineum]